MNRWQGTSTESDGSFVFSKTYRAKLKSAINKTYLRESGIMRSGRPSRLAQYSSASFSHNIAPTLILQNLMSWDYVVVIRSVLVIRSLQLQFMQAFKQRDSSEEYQKLVEMLMNSLTLNYEFWENYVNSSANFGMAYDSIDYTSWRL